MATIFTPGVNRHLGGERRHGARAGDYIMAAESQTRGAVPRCLTCFLIPPNKLSQMNIRYSSENSLLPRCTNSWKGEKNQLAALAVRRIISSGRLEKNTHVIIRSKSFASVPGTTAPSPHKPRFSPTVVNQIKVNGSLWRHIVSHDHLLFEMDPRWKLEGSRTTIKARLESMCQRFGRRLPWFVGEKYR